MTKERTVSRKDVQDAESFNELRHIRDEAEVIVSQAEEKMFGPVPREPRVYIKTHPYPVSLLADAQFNSVLDQIRAGGGEINQADVIAASGLSTNDTLVLVVMYEAVEEIPTKADIGLEVDIPPVADDGMYDALKGVGI